MDVIKNQMAFSHRVWIHDVFISFRGEDTRKTFVSHLDRALFTRGIVTFKDNRKLEVGDSIPDELCKAIRTSRFAIVVISERYGTSRWCLDELQLIMEHEDIEVVPIFYGVKPADVRHQLGSFSLEKYQGSKMEEKVEGWRKALTSIGNLMGKESTKCIDDATMIEEVVQSVSSRLLSMLPIDFGDIVGMKAHMEDLSPLLEMDSKKDEVRMIGICGMGGIGKTTIVKYLYEQLKFGFSPHYCFMENVGKLCGEYGLVHLQQKLLSSIFHEENVKLESVEHGRQQLEFRLRHVKVFLVLDNVDDMKQVYALAKEVIWFGPGSRIIITTRDKSLLDSCGVEFVYHVKCLDKHNALQLFQHIAFEGGGHPCSNVYRDLSHRVSRLAQGLPLAIEAFGFYLRGKSLVEWQDALRSFERAPYENTMSIIRICYDGLDEVGKTAFLHVTCLFNGDPAWRVMNLLNHGEVGIKVLAEKSLINISADGSIAMHACVEQTGSQISYGQQILYGYSILTAKGDTNEVEGVVLENHVMRDCPHISWRHFVGLHNLKFLIIFQHYEDLEFLRNCILEGNLLLPRNLRLLHWDAYPFTTLPSICSLNCLVEVNLRYSNLTTFWSGTASQRLLHLRRLDLTGSKDLKELPDLQEAVCLEELILEGCISLKRIPKSICSLSKLQKLDLSNCDGLKNLRIIIGVSEATVFQGKSLSVKSICLSFLDAESLVKEPQGVSLANLSIKGSLIVDLELLGGHAEHLCFISEQQIPHQLMMLEQETARLMSPPYGFKSLDIMRFNCSEKRDPFKCYSLSHFPWLTELNLINLNIEDIPDDIHHMRVLEKLDLSGNGFRVLPTTMMHLSLLKHVTLCNCRVLEALPELYQLETLTLSDCTNLRALMNLSQAEEDRGSYSLLELRLDNCRSVVSLSDELSHFKKLTYLDISRHDFETLPASIKDLSSNSLPQLLQGTEITGRASIKPQISAFSQITRFPVGRHSEEVPVCACFQKSKIMCAYDQGTMSLRSFPKQCINYKTLKLMAFATMCTGVFVCCRRWAIATK